VLLAGPAGARTLGGRERVTYQVVDETRAERGSYIIEDCMRERERKTCLLVDEGLVCAGCLQLKVAGCPTLPR
jgi:hypothetical protein